VGIAERQKRERDRRINMILDAATVVIAEKGIEGAKMEDIASTAEIGKSTIYNYFDSKQILLAGLDLRGTKIEEAGFLNAYESGTNGLDSTLKICQFYFEYSNEHAVLFKAKLQIGRIVTETLEQLMDNPLMKEYMHATQRINKILSNAIADGISDGSIRSDLDPVRMSLLLWCQSNGVIEIIQNREKMMNSFLGVTRNQIEDDFFKSIELQLKSSTSSSNNSIRNQLGIN